jgi:hypothetical protein
MPKKRKASTSKVKSDMKKVHEGVKASFSLFGGVAKGVNKVSKKATKRVDKLMHNLWN